MPKKKEVKKAESKEGDFKTFAFLATFLSIIGFIIALLVKRDDKYVMYYAKQGLVVFIAAIIVSVVGWVLFWIPVLGWIIKGVLNLIIAIIWIFSWIYALSGKMKLTPIVGQYADKIKL